MKDRNSNSDDYDPYIFAKGFLLLGLIGVGVAFIGNYSDKVSREKREMEEFSAMAKKEHAYRQAAFPPVDATAQLIHAELNQAHAKTVDWERQLQRPSTDRSKPIHISDRDCDQLFANETGWRVTLPSQKLPVLMAVKGINSGTRTSAAKADPLLKAPITKLDAFSIQNKGGLETLQHWKILLGAPPSAAKLVLLDTQDHEVKTLPIICRFAIQGLSSTSYFEGAAGSGIIAKPFYKTVQLFTK